MDVDAADCSPHRRGSRERWRVRAPTDAGREGGELAEEQGPSHRDATDRLLHRSTLCCAGCSLSQNKVAPFIAASPPPPHAMLRGCGACCACSASGFWPVPLPQARSRVSVRCICCAGMPGFCMMPAGMMVMAGLCVLGAAACGCACARALRAFLGLFHAHKPACVCLCAASAGPGCCVSAGCRDAILLTGLCHMACAVCVACRSQPLAVYWAHCLMSLVDLFPPQHRKKAIAISCAVVFAVFVAIVLTTVLPSFVKERPPPPPPPA